MIERSSVDYLVGYYDSREHYYSFASDIPSNLRICKYTEAPGELHGELRFLNGHEKHIGDKALFHLDFSVKEIGDKKELNVVYKYDDLYYPLGHTLNAMWRLKCAQQGMFTN